MVTTGSGLEDITLSSSPSRDAIEDGSDRPKMKRKKSVKGWDGEVMKPDLAIRMAQMHEENGTSIPPPSPPFFTQYSAFNNTHTRMLHPNEPS